jgi:hypothetical protein
LLLPDLPAFDDALVLVVDNVVGVVDNVIGVVGVKYEEVAFEVDTVSGIVVFVDVVVVG